MRKIGVVGITLLGLWIAVGAVNGLLASVPYFVEDGGFSLTFLVSVYLVPAIIVLIMGIVLVVMRERLAARLFADEPHGISIDAVAFLRIGIILAGLVFAVFAVEALVFAVAKPLVVAVSDRAAFGEEFAQPLTLASLLPTGLANGTQLLIGLLLTWFSLPLARWLWTHETPVPAPAVQAAPRACPECGASFDPTDYVPGASARCAECGAPLDLAGD